MGILGEEEQTFTLVVLATVMAHDISEYCVAQGSAVYMCSLDVEGAYDALPHAILLLETMKFYQMLPGIYYTSGTQICLSELLGTILLESLLL